MDSHDSLPISETFEGLGLGSRLAYAELGKKYNWIPIAAAVLYGITTPLGIAVGLGVRNSYNPESVTSSIVAGILDAISAGILVYTGLVEVCFSLVRLSIDRECSHVFYHSSSHMNSCSART